MVSRGLGIRQFWFDALLGTLLAPFLQLKDNRTFTTDSLGKGGIRDCSSLLEACRGVDLINHTVDQVGLQPIRGFCYRL